MKKIIAMLALISTVACIHRSTASPQPETTLRVENDSFSDMTIYVVRGLETVRLGIASGNHTSILKIPSSVMFGSTPLRFQARPLAGSRQPVTEEISVTPGDEVTMVIPAG